MTESDDDLELALRLADAADAISLERFGAADLHVDAKPDLTPVTDADVAVERAIRDLLAAHRPDDAILGEEFGAATDPGGKGPARRWVVDPIDGTKNFVRGVPVWATLIALMIDDDVVVGVVSAPALARRWWARAGGGAFGSFAGRTRALHVSGVREVADASLSFSELGHWEEVGLRAEFLALAESCWRTRAYGDFYSYVLVAEGAVDIACEPELKLWDLAALVPIVVEAGGTFTGADGAPADAAVRSALATNGRLHAAVLEALRAVTGRAAQGQAEISAQRRAT